MTIRTTNAMALDHHRTLAGSSARQLGAYYTPSFAARFMAEWAVRSGRERIIEPSMGSGEFLRAMQLEADRRGFEDLTIWGIELARDTYDATVGAGLVARERAVLKDFLAVEPFPVEVAIGNPPYVRLRHLPEPEADLASTVAAGVLGTAMDPSGSVWMPFVLHATQFLVPGGRLSFVLPYELTYVRYARSLWRYLADNFGHLVVIRVHERLFADILQDVVLLLADRRGEKTTNVEFRVYESTRGLAAGNRTHTCQIPIERIVNGERPFVEALLPAGLPSLLTEKITPNTKPLREVATFNIGYVCGDKTFFHPKGRELAEFDLPASSLVPTLISSRGISGAGLRTTSLSEDRKEFLFLPPVDGELTAGERRYVDYGAASGVSNRYKCRIRDPWFVTPGVHVPDLLLPVFADRPLLLINDAGLAASNSFLAGYLRSGSAEALAAAWYTSLTLLQIELNVHSLGGGVIVFVPRETGTVRVATGVWRRGHLALASRFIRSGRVDLAYESGDEAVLQDRLRLSLDEVEMIRAGVDSLRHWRTARPRHELPLGENIPEDEPRSERLDHAVHKGVDAHVQIGNSSGYQLVMEHRWGGIEVDDHVSELIKHAP